VSRNGARHVCEFLLRFCASSLLCTQGSFGELPLAACEQLGVVNACGHHLLNMINMARDMLRALDGGDLELNMSKVQASTPIDEVRHVWECWEERVEGIVDQSIQEVGYGAKDKVWCGKEVQGSDRNITG